MKRQNRRSHVSTMLVALVFTAFSCSCVHASNISGFTQTSGTFNIAPETINGATGLRSYTDFTLTNGDVANLQFDNGVETFVNMVTNRINIDGMVNSVRNSNFYGNGNAVFMSPNGMVVGENGVINVGSLSVLTPTAEAMKAYKNGNATLEQLGHQRTANVTINGRVVARGDIGIVAKQLLTGSGSIIYSGVNGYDSVINTPELADNLFSQLVNTGASGKSGSIDVRTYDKFEGNGRIVNLGTGDVQIVNRKDETITRTPGGLSTGTGAHIEAKNGSVILENYAGATNLSGNIAGSGNAIKIKNGSTAGALTLTSASINGNNGIEILDNSANSMNIDSSSTLSNVNGMINITNKKGDLNIEGTINSNQDGNGNNALLKIVNGKNATDAKTNGSITLGTINSNGDIQVINNVGNNGVNVNGVITNSGNTNITNRGGMLNVNRNIVNTNGTLALTGNSVGENAGVTISSGIKLSNNRDIKITNYGAQGLNIEGIVESTNGKISATNHGGDFNIRGTVKTAGDINLTNVDDHGYSAKDLNVSGVVESRGGEILIQNKGTGNFLLADSASVSNAGGRTYLQNTNGTMTVDGTVDNTSTGTNNGKIYIGNMGADGLKLEGDNAVKNNGRIEVVNFGDGGLSVNRDVTATGTGGVHITNRGGQMVVNKSVTTSTGEMTLSNIGDGGMNIASGSNVKSSGGNMIINNAKGDITINTGVSNSNGQIAISNSANGGKLSLTNDATVTNSGNARTYITNRGSDGMQIDGNVTTAGDVVLKNYSNVMNVASNVKTTNGNAYLTNANSGNMTVNGTVSAKNNVIVNNASSDVVLGNLNTKQVALDAGNKVSMTVSNGSIKNAGTDSTLIASDGIVYMNVYNGSIGENTNGKVDLTKSVNIDANGRLKAFTNAKTPAAAASDLGINIASQGKDIHVDRVKADGTAMLVTVKDMNGRTGSILNNSTNLTNYANVKGRNVQLISSGTIGTDAQSLHFRQTDPNQQSNVYAEGNINLHQRGEVEEQVNFNTITSKTGSVTADMIKNGNVGSVNAPGTVNVAARKKSGNFSVNSVNNDTTNIADPFTAK